MLTLLGGLIGFLSSALPEFLAMWRDKKDREHELSIIDRQMKQAEAGHQMKLEEISINGHIQESVTRLKQDSAPVGDSFVEKLRASVRPILTYAFFSLFAAVKICELIAYAGTGMDLYVTLPQIWDDETMALFAAIMAYWFGDRRFHKNRCSL